MVDRILLVVGVIGVYIGLVILDSNLNVLRGMIKDIRIMADDILKKLPEKSESQMPLTITVDQDLSLDYHKSDSIEPLDDNVYEQLILKRLNNEGIIIYYSNYTSSNVKVEGEYFSDYCIERNPESTALVKNKAIFEWEGSERNLIKYAFRVTVDKSSFLIWGDTRENAFLNLLEFAERYRCTRE